MDPARTGEESSEDRNSSREDAEEQRSQSTGGIPDLSISTHDEIQNTELDNVQKDPKASWDKYRDLSDCSPVGSFTLTGDGLITGVNLTGATMLGVARKDLIDTPFIKYVSPEGHNRFHNYLLTILTHKEQQTGEFDLIRDDRLQFSASIEGICGETDEGVVQVRIAVWKGPDHRLAKNELITTHSRLESVMDAGSIAWWEMDCITGNVIFHDRKVRMLGYQSEHFSHYSDFTRIVHPDDYEPLMQIMRDYLSGKTDRYEADYRICAQNGEYLWFHDTGKISEYASDGSPLKVIGLVKNITPRKRVEEALIESEAKFRGIFDTINDGLHIHEIEPDGTPGKFIEINEVACQMLQYTREELLRHSPLDFVTGYHNRPFHEIIEELTKEGHAFFETEHRRKDGTIIPVEINTHAVSLQGRKVAISVVRDISERKKREEQLRQTNQRLTLAAELSKFGVWDLDLIGYTLEWDAWMLLLYGISQEEFDGTYEGWLKRIHPEDQIRVNAEVEQATREEKDFDIEFCIIRPDGEIRYLKANASVVKDGESHPIRMTGISYDITDRKRYDWEITQYAEQLGAQNLSLEELSDKMAIMNQELDEKVRERTEVISHMLTIKTDLITQIGHDLKTPLTSLIALLPYIYKKVNDPELRELLEVVTLDAKRMNQIISSILTLSAFDIKNPDELVGESRVADIVDRVISAEHLIISQRSLNIGNLLSPSCLIRMNDSHCDLLFSNIIGNAVKYSKLNGTISINSEIIDDILCLIVQDDGQGIAYEHLPRIFEEFFKVDTSRHDRDSQGLGLALVQRIVNSYGGTITAESAGVDRGTTIRVCFPASMVIRSPQLGENSS